MPSFTLRCTSEGCDHTQTTSPTTRHSQLPDIIAGNACPKCGGELAQGVDGGTGFQLSMRGTDGKTMGANTHGWSSRGRCGGKVL